MAQKILIFLLSFLLVPSFVQAKLLDKKKESGLVQEIDAEILFPEETEPRNGKIKVYYSPLAEPAEAIAKAARYVPTVASGLIQPVPYILKQMKSVYFEYQEGNEKKTITIPNPISYQIADLLNFNGQGAVEENGNIKIVNAKKVRVTATQKFTFEYGDTFGAKETLKWMLLTGQVDYVSKTLDENLNIVEKNGSVNIFKFRDPRIFKKFQPADNQRLVLPIGDTFSSEVIYMGQSNDSKHIFVRKQDLDNTSEGVAVYAIAPELVSQAPKEKDQLLIEPFYQFFPTIPEGVEPVDYIEQSYPGENLNKKVDAFQNGLAKTGVIQRILPCQRFFARLLQGQNNKPKNILHGK